MVAFEKLEALRYLDYLRPDGVAFVCPLEVPPVAQNLKKGAGYVQEIDRVLDEKAPRLVWVEAERIARELGDLRLVNVALLGALSAALPLQAEHWEAAIRERFSPKTQEGCLMAFRKGAEHAPLFATR